MPECPPARDYSVTSVSKLNYDGVANPLTRPANIVVSGIAAADTDSVDLTLGDGDPGTPDITRTGIVPTAGTGGKVWSASIPVGETNFDPLAQTGLADGDVNVSASFNITPAGGTPATIPGQPMTVAKDTVRPPAPVATPGEGSFKTSPVSVSLDPPPDDTDHDGDPLPARRYAGRHR
jgi:hypothetical protein